MTSSTIPLGQAWSDLGACKIGVCLKGNKRDCWQRFSFDISILFHLVDQKELLSEVMGGKGFELSQAPRVVSTHKRLLHQAVNQSVLLLVGNQTWSCPPYPGQIGW